MASFIVKFYILTLSGFDKAKNSPIHWACRAGHDGIVKLLIDKNVALNSQVFLHSMHGF